MKLLCTNSSYQRKKENLDGNQVRLMSCGILPTSSPGVGASPGFPGRFVLLLASFVSLWTLLRIRGFCVFEFGNSARHQPVCYLMSFLLGILSSSQDMMHCQLSSTVYTCTTCHRASFNSTTDSFLWGHDPYTLACKARPSFDRCGTSLSVTVIVIVSCAIHSGCLARGNSRTASSIERPILPRSLKS